MPGHWSPEFWQGRRVWLSGHTGFKGSWLALWLLHWGADVEGYALDPEPEGGPPLFESLGLAADLVRDERADLADQQRLAARLRAFEPEVVFHLAAQPLVQRSYREPLLTWNTNVIGTCHVLEALRQLDHPCVAVMITTDKVYDNREWDYGYREGDPLGGHDPYSSSKAAAELAIASWRASFCGSQPHQQPGLRLVSARAGNVIGGGDWAEHRIVPDAMRALMASEPIAVRAPASTRPWQHVLEPLGGYLQLAEQLHAKPGLATAFNFGPDRSANRSVCELVEEILRHWPGSWCDQSDPAARHEAGRLDLSTDRAYHQLGWAPRWNFATTIAETVAWYRRFQAGEDARQLCLEQIERYVQA
jgi:CDP-glucose 4,6-dehydratase